LVPATGVVLWRGAGGGAGAWCWLLCRRPAARKFGAGTGRTGWGGRLGGRARSGAPPVGLAWTGVRDGRSRRPEWVRIGSSGWKSSGLEAGTSALADPAPSGWLLAGGGPGWLVGAAGSSRRVLLPLKLPVTQPGLGRELRTGRSFAITRCTGRQAAAAAPAVRS